MRDIAIVCFAISIPGVAGCTDERAFTVEEQDKLQAFRLRDSAPADPSNRFADNTAAAVLGKQFYFDPRFSGELREPNDGASNGSLGQSGTPNAVACASCHQPDLGGADVRSRPAATSLGAGYTGRNAPTVINAAYSDVATGGWQFWDGRSDSLWSQALGPVESGVEHNGTRLQFAHLIFDHYRAAYEAIFEPLPDLTNTARFPSSGKPGQPSFDGMAEADRTAVNRIYANFGKAIAAYERRLISPAFAPSPFDNMLDGDDRAMSASAIRGAKLFIGKAACDECHRGPQLTDFKFHNIGCPQEGENVPTTDLGRFDGIASAKADLFNRAGPFSDHVDDSHLATLEADDRAIGAFKTPSLRNVARTAPYMHDGVYTDLWDVVEHYNFGGATGSYAGTKDVALAPLLLDDRELGDLVEFLRSLDDGEALPSTDFPEGLTSPPSLP